MLNTFIGKHKNDLLACLLFFALTLVFFFRFLDGQEVFAFKDLSRYFYPLRHLMVEQVKLGVWPLWNPFIFYGMPLMASLQPGLFYPMTLIFYVLPFDPAFNYYIILHYFLASCFTYFFMRHIGASRIASFFSGLVFSFSGYLLSVSNMNTSMSSVIWLPLLLLLWDKTIKEKGRNYIYFILCLAAMLLGGEPTIIYASAFVLLSWALVFAPSLKEKAGNALLLIAGLIITIALTAVQLLPFYELIIHSDRAIATKFDMVTLRSLPIREIINFVMPYFFGNQAQTASYNPVLLGKMIQDWLLSPYVGIMPILLMLFSFFNDKKAVRWFFAGAALVSLLMAFGRYTPLYFILYKLLPGLSMIRYPVKYLFLTTFSIAVLAGLGIDAVNKDEKTQKRAAIVFFVAFLILGAIYLLAISFQDQIFMFLKSRYSNLHPFFAEVLWKDLIFDIKSIWFVMLVTLASAILFFARAKGIIKNLAFGIVIAGIVFFDLFSNNTALIVPSSRQVYHEITPNVKLLMKEAGINRYYYSKQVEEHNHALFGDDYDKAMLEAQDKLAACQLMRYKLYDSNGYESIGLKSYLDFYLFFFDKEPFRYLNVLNLANSLFLADLKPVKAPGLKLKSKHDYFYGSLYLYQNLSALPRAYVTGAYIVATNEAACLNVLADRRFDPKKHIVLEENPGRIGGQKYKEAKISEYGINRVLIETDLAKPGFLFLSDSYYPGWKAYVDGKETRIYRANFMFRAVPLNRGSHKIEFVYDPLSFKLGMVISIITAFGLLLAWWKLK
ncbi:MAG: YfhO family protein [Candidatus Margulisiibacteriota bacterium]